MEIYLRRLEEKDAFTSHNWRNDPEIWKLTGKRPDRIITPKIELEWMRSVLNNKNESRFAICIKSSNEYIGNVQLTNLLNGSAEFHIFIGEKKYWGKGIGTKATLEMIKIGFEDLLLNEIYLFVNKMNIPAIKAYLNCGLIIDTCSNEHIKMVIVNGK